MRTTYQSGWIFKQDQVLVTDLTNNGYCNTPENSNPSSGAYHDCSVGHDCSDCAAHISPPPPPPPSPSPPPPRRLDAIKLAMRETFLAAADDDLSAAGATTAGIIVGAFVGLGALVGLVVLVVRSRNVKRPPLFVQHLDAVQVETARAEESAPQR